ncbi:MAG: YdgA family protein [Acidobacteriia bacterium]|nr:YdgA family protein [Terriglobia bacterium]
MRVFRVTALLILLLSAAAFADNVTFNTNTTLGCFSSGTCTPSSSSDNYNPIGTNNTVTFNGSGTGDLTTSGGSLAFTLGTFSWQGSASNYNSSENFYATVSFSLPTGIVPGQTEAFSADIVGLTSYNPDHLQVDFSNTPVAFTFNNGTYTGSFNFYVDDVTFTSSGDNKTWTGHVTGANQTLIVPDPPPPPPPPGEAPEPGSLVLMGSGLMAMAGVLRRKLRR